MSEVGCLIKNRLGLKVFTDSGWSDFEGIVVKGEKHQFEITTAKTSIKTTAEHKLFTPELDCIEAKDVIPGHTVLLGLEGSEMVKNVVRGETESVYDLVNVVNGNRFYANNLLVANCRFITADETLIAPAKLAELEKSEPVFKKGQVKWFTKPKKDGVYVIALDPSVGTGGDAAAIEVYDVNTTEQVAEWEHNKTPIQDQIRILADICEYLHEFTQDARSIYYSVENNSVGEAALVSIAEYDESNIKGYFLSEPGKQRKGFTTTKRTKMAACNKLKMLIEKDKMHVKSGRLISELKTYVARGQIGYEAKIGEHDDLVAATLIAVRMLQTLQSYYPELDSHIKDHSDVIAPMPFVVMFG